MSLGHLWFSPNTNVALYIIMNANQTSYKLAILHMHILGPCFLNPFTLRAAKRGRTILEIFPFQKQFFENISMRNVDQKTNNKSPSNILWNFASFPSHFQKYESSRRYFERNSWVWMGLTGVKLNALWGYDILAGRVDTLNIESPVLMYQTEWYRDVVLR